MVDRTYPFPRIEDHLGADCDSGPMPTPARDVVVHETEGSTFEGGLETLKHGDGSAHYMIGWDASGKLRIARIAHADREMCHTGGQNYRTLGIEKAGLSWWKRAFRLVNKHERIAMAAQAWLVANLCHANGISPTYLSIKRLKTRSRLSDFEGWTYHRNCSYAYRTTTHTDPGVPGVSWPHRRFRTYVLYYFNHPEVHEYVPYGVAKRKKEGKHP